MAMPFREVVVCAGRSLMLLLVYMAMLPTMLVAKRLNVLMVSPCSVDVRGESCHCDQTLLHKTIHCLRLIE